MVHQKDPSITWCGFPTNWEPYELVEGKKGKNCATCKKADEEWLTQQTLMNQMQRMAKNAKW